MRSIILRACLLAGSRPRSFKATRLLRVTRSHFRGSPQYPAGDWAARSWAPQPSVAMRDRSAAIALGASPVRSLMTCQRMAGSESRSHLRCAGRGAKDLAEREGFYLPSFRKLRRCLDFNDIILYSCVFQADSQSTFRVLASTPGYSQHHVKRKESVSVVSPKQPHDVKKSRDVPPFRPCRGRAPEYPSWWTEAVSNRSAVAFK